MNKGRLEAFSDGVIAIIITIMVLQLTVPKEPTFAALLPLTLTMEDGTGCPIRNIYIYS